MTKTSYSYTVLRYVHDTTTGEFINAGVVLLARDLRFLGVKMRHTHGRLSAMFPDLDRDAFRSSMRVIEHALKDLAETYAKDDLFPLASDALVIARTVLPHDDSSLQWSPVGGGLTSDPPAALDRVFERLVARYDGKTERVKRTDEDVWRPVKERLDRAGLSSRLRPTVIHGKVDEIKFNRAWKNGIWHCYEPLSFDLADAEYIKDKARRWSGFLSTVRDAADQFKPIFIVGAPHDEKLMPAFKNAVEILRNSPVQPEVFAESDADRLAAQMEADISAHA
jgi:Protein of unknown function (DUF3037)